MGRAVIPSADESQLNRNAGFRELREMVLKSVVSKHSKRNYAKALDDIFTLCEQRTQPFSRVLFMEYRSVRHGATESLEPKRPQILQACTTFLRREPGWGTG